MTLFQIALLQMSAPGSDQAASLAKGQAFCRRAKALGADLALFPEMWNVGYTYGLPEYAPEYDLYLHPERWPEHTAPMPARIEEERAGWAQEQAIGAEDEFVLAFRRLARELDMAIALTYLEKWPGAPRNSVSLIDRRGEIVLTYAKMHTCDFCEPEASLTPGEEFPVVALDTAHGPVQVGAMICMDREFPEAARLLMLGGAEIIIIPNACEMEANRLGQLRARATENMVGVALANYALPTERGHSVAYHPCAFGPQERSRDTLVVEAGEQEGVYLAPFDMDEIRRWRAAETWGNSFRRPHRYGPLTSADVAEPFTRVDRRGRPYPRLER